MPTFQKTKGRMQGIDRVRKQNPYLEFIILHQPSYYYLFLTSFWLEDDLGLWEHVGRPLLPLSGFVLPEQGNTTSQPLAVKRKLNEGCLTHFHQLIIHFSKTVKFFSWKWLGSSFHSLCRKLMEKQWENNYAYILLTWKRRYRRGQI